MNSIFIHFNVTAALFFFRDSNKGLFVDNCFMMIGKQIPCSLLALRRVAHENCGCSRTTAIFFIAEKRIDRSSTPFRLSCWRRYGTRFEFVDNTDNTIPRQIKVEDETNSFSFLRNNQKGTIFWFAIAVTWTRIDRPAALKQKPASPCCAIVKAYLCWPLHIWQRSFSQSWRIGVFRFYERFSPTLCLSLLTLL